MNACQPNLRLWYLSGGMTKFGSHSFEESNNWRLEVKRRIWEVSDHNIICFNPNDHYNCTTDITKFTDREAMNLDLHKLRQSELLIFNNNDPFSRGSMIELGIAWERRIPIITLNESEGLHCWVEQMSEKVCSSIGELIEYLYDHYIRID